ncbi:MAG: AAA family ATPase [Planctomycetes bacterium]|nr:AAA family ATPase [Planctomycetota bacterium]
MGRGAYKVEDFVGQKDALRPALSLQDGAMRRGERAPHMLFDGPSGCGKSFAANTLGTRAGTTVTKILGKATVAEIATKLVAMKAFDIAFFDECHNLDNDSQELLFEVIDSSQLAGSLVPGANPGEPVDIEPITLIFATDRPGKLLDPLVKRIPLRVRFKPYPIDEMKEIVARIGSRRGVLFSAQAAHSLAQLCHGIPRRAEHHVNNLRLTFDDSERRQMSVQDVRTYSEGQQLTVDGLDEYARDYLKHLHRVGSASVEALAGYLGTDVDNLKKQIEQPLRFRGLVTIGHGGRVLTSRGEKWAEKNVTKKAKETDRG